MVSDAMTLKSNIFKGVSEQVFLNGRLGKC